MGGSPQRRKISFFVFVGVVVFLDQNQPISPCNGDVVSSIGEAQMLNFGR